MALISRFHLLIILTPLITTDITLGAAANSRSIPQCHLSGMDPLGENPMLAEVSLSHWSYINLDLLTNNHKQKNDWPQISTRKRVLSKWRGWRNVQQHLTCLMSARPLTKTDSSRTEIKWCCEVLIKTLIKDTFCIGKHKKSIPHYFKRTSRQANTEKDLQGDSVFDEEEWKTFFGV